MSKEITPGTPETLAGSFDALQKGIDNLKALAKERADHVATLKQVVATQAEIIKTYKNMLALNGQAGGAN